MPVLPQVGHRRFSFHWSRITKRETPRSGIRSNQTGPLTAATVPIQLVPTEFAVPYLAFKVWPQPTRVSWGLALEASRRGFGDLSRRANSNTACKTAACPSSHSRMSCLGQHPGSLEQIGNAAHSRT